MTFSPEYLASPIYSNIRPNPLDVELATAFNDLEIARKVLYLPRRYSTAVETEVGSSMDLALAVAPMRADDPFYEWLRYVWKPEELDGHGAGQAAQCRALGIEPIPGHHDKVSRRHHAIGNVARRNETTHGLSKLVLLGHMMCGERETMAMYKWEAGVLARNNEFIASDYSRMLLKQEAAHLKTQREEALQLVDRMPSAMSKLAGYIVKSTYTPVGFKSGDILRMTAFGDLLRVATTDKGMVLSQKVAHTLAIVFKNLSSNDLFLQKHYNECIRLSMDRNPSLVDEYYRDLVRI